MSYANYDDVVDQLREAGLVLELPLKVATGSKSVRCLVDGGDAEKRGWYRLHEWLMDSGDLMLVGSFGVFHGDDPGTCKVELTKKCTACSREMGLKEKACPSCGSKDIQKRGLSDEQKAALKDRMAQDKKRAQAERNAEIEQAAQWAAAVWRSCREPEPNEHGYLARKKLKTTGGARIFVSNDGINLVGANGDDYKYLSVFHGALVVPMCDATGKVFGLQFILDRIKHKDRISRTERDKDYWPAGMSVESHYWLIGPSPSVVCLTAEGFATGLTLHEETGHPVAVAFAANNLGPVAKAIKAQYRRAKQLICADDDFLQRCAECKTYTIVAETNCTHCGKPHRKQNAGVRRAADAALAVDGAWIAPVFSAPRPVDRKGPTDFNDLAALEGPQAVRAQIEQRLVDLKIAPVPAAPSRDAGADDQGGGERRRAESVMPVDELVDRFMPLDDGTGDYVFDTWTNRIAKKAQMLSMLPAGARGDDIKRHPVWQARGAFYLDQVGFDPTGKDEKIKLNTWKGFEMKPEYGPCDLITDLASLLCSAEKNAEEVRDFLLDSLAFQVQNPGVKLASAIIMQGGQGAGKSTFFDIMMSIFGRYGKTLNQRALEDKFNSDWVEEALFVKCEEIAASADVWHIKGEVKDLITGEHLRANEKNSVARSIRNRMNFVILSNETIPIPLDRDDRRMLVIRTPPAAPQDFYREVHRDIENGGIARFFGYLLKRDVSKFHPKTQPPMTESKRRLIVASSPSEQIFVEEWLEGSIEFGGRQLPVCPCTGTQLHTAYARWARHSLVSRPRDLNQFISFIHGLSGWQAGKSCATFEDLNSSAKKNRKMIIPSYEALAKSTKHGATVIDQGTNSQQRWLTDGFFAFNEVLAAAQ